MGDLFGSKNPTKGKIYFEPCFQLSKINDLGHFEKSQQVYLSENEAGSIGNPAIRNTVIPGAENSILVSIYKTKSGKESIIDQELDICNRKHQIATYNIMRVCVTIKKYNVNKPPYIQIYFELYFERIQTTVPNFGRLYVC